VRVKAAALLGLLLSLVPVCDRLSSARPDASALEVRRGERRYNQYCLSCHAGPTGGSMMDYPPRHNARGHTWHHSDCQLKETIKNGGDEMTATR